MKSQEEIKQLAKLEIERHRASTSSVDPSKDMERFKGYIAGYTQCQEDMRKVMYEFGKRVLDTFHSEGKTHSGENRLAMIKYHEWFNEL